MKSTLAQDDEFVLTLSDNDPLPQSESESDDVPEPKQTSGVKRKRQNTQREKPVKRKKTQSKTNIDVEYSLNESDSLEEQGVKDGAIDSDFEFDMGGHAISDVIEDFDGWGANGPELAERQVNGVKKHVDIDEIIARRRKRNSEDAGTLGPGDSLEDIPSEQTSETGEDVDKAEQEIDGTGSEEEIEFDDENLAPDTFGAAAESEEEQTEEDETDSDRSSVASPMPHPDDVNSDTGSGNESRTSESDPEEEAKRKAFFAADDEVKQMRSKTASSFQQFSLSRPILRGLAALSFHTPTAIQRDTVPIALQGRDVVGSAQTGSGKTAAFLLPILERLLYRPRKIPTTRVAILMPTRELAVQCYGVATALARFTDVTFAQVVGGFSLREQETILKRRPDVVIATPGRFIDHMRNSASFAVENLEILVLDEADRMLDQGFADELDEILRTIPKSRQTMLFSATMTESVDKLVRVGMNRPIRVSVDAKKSTVAGLVQEFVRLRPGREEMRLAALSVLCTKVSDYRERTIVFFRQKKEAHRVRIVFGLLGIRAGELHGSMTQDQRISAVNAFRDGKTTHLLATDVASRGLDIKNIMSVVNYEAPQTHDLYLHRVGRTARAGRTGKACTIAAKPDRRVVKAAVKAARAQGAKVVSRMLEISEVNAMNDEIEGFANEIEEILKEEKQEKQLSQMEKDVLRGENLVKHRDEILARPKRTWFESEKEKKAAKDRAREELNGTLFKGEKKKLSNKDKKRLDLHRERVDGNRQWKKGKVDAVDIERRKKQKSKGSSRKPGKPRLNGKRK